MKLQVINDAVMNLVYRYGSREAQADKLRDDSWVLWCYTGRDDEGTRTIVADRDTARKNAREFCLAK